MLTKLLTLGSCNAKQGMMKPGTKSGHLTLAKQDTLLLNPHGSKLPAITSICHLGFATYFRTWQNQSWFVTQAMATGTF